MTQSDCRTVKLFIIEPTEFHRILYQMTPQRGPIDVVGVSDTCAPLIAGEMFPPACPGVLLLGVKELDADVAQRLEQTRLHNGGLGTVLLLGSPKHGDAEALRRLAGRGKGGMAVFLKASLERLDQLVEIILQVSRGQIVLDPAIAGAIFGGRVESPFLDSLTNREMEIVGLLARGYSNSGIAGRIFVTEKTVEHHLNSVYGKLKAAGEFDDKHLRVATTRLYLQESGAPVSNWLT